MPEGSRLVGRPLHQTELDSHGGFLVVAVHMPDGEALVQSTGGTTLEAGDAVVMVCHKGVVPEFKWRYLSKGNLQYRGASG